MAAITSSNYRNPAIDKIQSGYNPSGYSPALPPYIDSVSGSVTQGSTMTIAAVNASSETSATLQFTDFESLTVGQPVVGNIPWLDGDTEVLQKNYLASTDRPLTGTKVAKTHPVQENFGGLYYLTGGVNELFVEFYARTVTPDFTGSPDAAQIKFTRISSDPASHTVEPLLGTIMEAGGSTITYGLGLVNAGADFNQDVWERHTLYLRLSTPDVPDGMRVYRTSFTANWSYGGISLFETPNEWIEPFSITRTSGAQATRQLQRMFFPFYQRAQQETIIDINHIYIHSNLERVYMSTSPTATASLSFTHVSCETISRALTSIQFKSMIDVFDAADDVYLYVVNVNGKVNSSGYLVRAGA